MQGIFNNNEFSDGWMILYNSGSGRFAGEWKHYQ